MTVVLLGSGNTATVLGRLIQKCGHKVMQVVSRDLEHAKQLANLLETDYDSINAPSYKDADIYIVALHDHVLEGLDRFPGLKNKFIVHNAAGVSMNVLSKCTENFGVLYPLQTLSKYVDHFPEIPLMIDANNADNLDTLLSFAKTLSDNVSHVNDKQRMAYHVAAVFAANYANHMYAIAEIYCQRENIDFKNMLPIINENCNKVNHYSPFLTQTGPAIRDDVFTMSKNLEALTPYPELKYIYLKITESIIKIHGKR